MNFEVDEHFRDEVERLRDSLGLRTQKQVLEEAIQLLRRREQLVKQQGRSLIAVRLNAVEEVARVAGDVVIVDEPTAAWSWLVQREGWRSTPWIKGHRLHVSDIMAFLDETAAERLGDGEVAAELDIPREAVAESRAYIARHRELIEAENREADLRIRNRGGHATPPR